MPTEITITAYAYDELEGKAKDKARETLTELSTSYEWWDSVYEDAKADAKELGFDIEDIRFSGFWSQGDGASWTGYVDLLVFIEKHADKESATLGQDMTLCELMRNGWVSTRMEINRRSFHYAHENTMNYEYAGYDLDGSNQVLEKGIMAGASVSQLLDSFDVDAHIDTWLEKAHNAAKDYARKIYRQLEAEYEGLVTDEYLTEFAAANEYLFDENGRSL